jgi:hypothetical protein
MSRAETDTAGAEGDTPIRRMLPHLSSLTGQNVGYGR